MNDLISVIVPVYKVEEWLDQCVESIVNQSYQNLEVILVDDGSPDNCPQMCDDWAKKDKRIKVIHKENGGLSSARNAALDIITGNYISFIDSDDYLHRDMYEIMITDLKRTNADIVKCGRFIDKDGIIEEYDLIKDKKEYDRESALDCFFYHKNDFCSGVWDKLYKKKLFDELRFPDGFNSEDYYVYAYIYDKAKKLYYNAIPLYYYRIREDSISRKNGITKHSFDKVLVSDMVYNYYADKHPERKKDASVFQAISRFHIYQEVMDYYEKKDDILELKSGLREKLSSIIFNKKTDIVFKLKYLVLTVNPRLYGRIKNK